MDKNKQNLFVFLLGSLAMIGPLNIDTCLPALSHISKDFGVPFSDVEISMSLFFLFFGVGQLLGGYYSDRKGRKVIVVSGLIISLIASVLLSFSNGLNTFYIGRAVQALGGGFVGVSIAAIVRDNFTGKDAASVMSLVTMIAMGAPLVAPTIGATLLKFFTWHSIFIFIGIYSIIVLVPFFMKMKNKVPDPSDNISFLRGLKTVYSNKPALAYMCVMAIPSGALYTYLTTAPFVYQEFFKLSESHFAIIFGLNGGGLIIMNKINSVLVQKHSPRKLLHIGLCIHLSTLSLILLSILFFTPQIYIVLPLLTLHLSSLGLLSGNATSIALEKYEKKFAGLANSQMRVVGIAFGALAGATASKLNNGTLVPAFAVMFACSLLGIALYITLKNFDLERKSI
ncbi:multidrug effflux MFS transporter [Flammeovirga sp. MY04]|uniref:multidrug effflux MFS transporter n=1 Tax=Flammeovirga sp. MY04 TaxID=1191459 RepID=UPI0008061446|nr:multidrug effflux MFS transporter [Flammeovirga sp. MY04]ANQ51394.1 multidrug effflux MFS transporter [Flammeovirga sp. MY04]